MHLEKMGPFTGSIDAAKFARHASIVLLFLKRYLVGRFRHRQMPMVLKILENSLMKISYPRAILLLLNGMSESSGHKSLPVTAMIA